MKNRIFFVVGVLFLILENVGAIAEDLDFYVDKTNWVDPNDPLNDAKRETAQISETCLRECDDSQWIKEKIGLLDALEKLKQTSDNSVDVLLKHILREFVVKLNIDLNSETDIFKKALVSLSTTDLHSIQRYLQSTEINEEFGLREDVRFALENFLVETDHRNENSLFSMLHFLVPYVMFMNLILLPAMIYYLFKSIFSFKQLFIMLIIIAFTTSCYFTYSRKYQEILAQRFERVQNKDSSTCTPKGLLSEAYDVILSYVKIKGKSECLQTYEDMLIEPILLVDPLQVIAEVIANVFFSPLSVAGTHFNKFFNDFFVNTPIHLAIFKGLFLVLLLFYLTGYRIRTLLATIEPAESISRLLPQSLQNPSNNNHLQALPQSPSPKQQHHHQIKSVETMRSVKHSDENFMLSSTSFQRLSLLDQHNINRNPNRGGGDANNHSSTHMDFDSATEKISALVLDDSKVTVRKSYGMTSPLPRKSKSTGRFSGF